MLRLLGVKKVGFQGAARSVSEQLPKEISGTRGILLECTRDRWLPMRVGAMPLALLYAAAACAQVHQQQRLGEEYSREGRDVRESIDQVARSDRDLRAGRVDGKAPTQSRRMRVTHRRKADLRALYESMLADPPMAVDRW